MSESTQTPPAVGTICWNEVYSDDTAKSKAFYTELFGWTAESMDFGTGSEQYTFFKNGDQGAAGMMAITKDMCDMKPMWVSYVTVEDVDASAAKAESLGAKIWVPPTDIPNMGRFSLVCDPGGAVLGIYQGT